MTLVGGSSRGADVFVAGENILGSSDIAGAVRALREAAAGAGTAGRANGN